MERNKKCKIAGILFSVILLYEVYRVIVCYREAMMLSLDYVWKLTLGVKFTMGSFWLVFMIILISVVSLILMIVASFKTGTVKNKKMKPVVAYCCVMLLLWFIAYPKWHYFGNLMYCRSIASFFRTIRVHHMPVVGVILFLIAYYLLRTGDALQEKEVQSTSMDGEEGKINYYKNLLEHQVLTEAEYELMVEKVKQGKLF